MTKTSASAANANRIALGTAQFGLTYGIANKMGKVPIAEVGRILDAAWAAGVNTLDTAIGYGDSEACLGEIGVSDWRVVSKLPGIPAGTRAVQAWVLESIHGSLRRLKVPSLYAVLLHRPLDLLGPDGRELGQALLRLKAKGLVKKIGVSVYSPEALDSLLDRWQIDVVQLPFNVLDRRAFSADRIQRFESAGIEIHTRSAFLQGLLLMAKDGRGPYFDQWPEVWARWHSWLEGEQVSPVRAALGCALGQAQTARVIVGVDSLIQLEEILRVSGEPSVCPPEDLAMDDLALLNPSNWPKA